MFREAATWAARRGSFSAQDVEEAHLRAFKSLDAPLAPSQRGSAFFASRPSRETRQEFRERLLDVKREDLREVSERYLLEGNNGRRSVAVVGGTPPKNNGDWTVMSGSDGKVIPLSAD